MLTFALGLHCHLFPCHSEFWISIERRRPSQAPAALEVNALSRSAPRKRKKAALPALQQVGDRHPLLLASGGGGGGYRDDLLDILTRAIDPGYVASLQSGIVPAEDPYRGMLPTLVAMVDLHPRMPPPKLHAMLEDVLQHAHAYVEGFWHKRADHARAMLAQATAMLHRLAEQPQGSPPADPPLHQQPHRPTHQYQHHQERSQRGQKAQKPRARRQQCNPSGDPSRSSNTSHNTNMDMTLQATTTSINPHSRKERQPARRGQEQVVVPPTQHTGASNRSSSRQPTPTTSASASSSTLPALSVHELGHAVATPGFPCDSFRFGLFGSNDSSTRRSTHTGSSNSSGSTTLMPPPPPRAARALNISQDVARQAPSLPTPRMATAAIDPRDSRSSSSSSAIGQPPPLAPQAAESLLPQPQAHQRQDALRFASEVSDMLPAPPLLPQGLAERPLLQPPSASVSGPTPPVPPSPSPPRRMSL